MRTVTLARCLRVASWQRVLTSGVMLVLFVAPVRSQTISGRVIDSTTSEAIEGSDVFLFDVQGDTIGVVKSGAGGHFVLAAAAGSYTLRVRCLGHRPKEIAIRLAADTNVTVRLARLRARGEYCLADAGPGARQSNLSACTSGRLSARTSTIPRSLK